MAESDFPAGDYVLCVDQYEQREYTDDRLKEVRNTKTFYKGDTINLDEPEALRLGRSGAVAEEGTLEAKKATGEVNPQYAPAPTTPLSTLEAQKEAIEAAIEDRHKANDKEEDAREQVRTQSDTSSPDDPKGAGNTDSATSKRRAKSS